MRRWQILLVATALASAGPAAAETLILPAFAHNVRGFDGAIWSSELYLTNPGTSPVQVALVDLLGDDVSRPAPCDLFMTPTRVIPPHSAVLWTASGLATDLGCAERALGALVLNADGPIQVTSRMVRTEAGPEGGPPQGALTGPGQEFEALSLRDLPHHTELVLPALMWHRDPCGPPAFETSIGIANPSPEPVGVRLDLEPAVIGSGLRLSGTDIGIPHDIVVPARGWVQLRLEPVSSPDGSCRAPESFAARLHVTGPVAVYASVVDRIGNDPRTVLPVPMVPATGPTPPDR